MFENDDLENNNPNIPNEDNDIEFDAVEETEFDEVSKQNADNLENKPYEEEDIFDDLAQSYNSSESYSNPINEDPITVQPVKFASFDDSPNNLGESNKNLDILMDIKLQLTVELGRTTLPIKKVLELTRGSIVELEKIAGEPVELYANGKLIAHGEVVVIEDNFGLRITSITDPDERLKGIQ